jgi:PD-(D/E)XK endonuclease
VFAVDLRQANPRRQGDIGEIAAIEWLSRQGAQVWIPLTHSPDVDLVADFGRELLKVQVKTSTYYNKCGRWEVVISTRGGNQSWNGVVKYLDPSRCDYLFVLVGDGRRWFIPTTHLECRSGLTLGGSKYAEFEVDREGVPGQQPPLESACRPGEYPSGQRTAAVNRLPLGFAGSNPASPIEPTVANGDSSRRGSQPSIRYATIWGKRRLTIPREVFAAAGLRVGDRLRAVPVGEGRVIFERIEEAGAA